MAKLWRNAVLVAIALLGVSLGVGRTASALDQVVLSTDLARSQASCVLQFTVPSPGFLDKFRLIFPPPMLGAEPILTGLLIGGKPSPPPIVTSVDPADGAFVVDLPSSIGVRAGTPILIEVAGLTIPVGGAYEISLSLLTANGTIFAATLLPFTASWPGDLGNSNTATGAEALLSNVSGVGNTAAGAQALFSNTSGTNNTATGVFALVGNTTGSGNTATGVLALADNTGGAENTANGHAALRFNTTGDFNTAIGHDALTSNTAGGGNTAAGAGALASNTVGTSNTAFGAGADVSANGFRNATAIGAGAIVDSSHKIRLGNATVSVIEGQVGFTSSSDATKKENFRPVDGEAVLEKVRRLPLASWNFIGHDPEQLRHYGPSAQDFFAAFGHDGVGTIGTPTTITSTDMAGVLMIAVQALERRTAEYAALKARLEALERLVQESGIPAAKAPWPSPR